MNYVKNAKIFELTANYPPFFLEIPQNLTAVEMQVLTVLLRRPFPLTARGIWDGIVENCFSQLQAYLQLSDLLGLETDSQLSNIIKEEQKLREQFKDKKAKYCYHLATLLKKHGAIIPSFYPVYDSCRELEKMGFISSRKRKRDALLFVSPELRQKYLEKKQKLANSLMALKEEHNSDFRQLFAMQATPDFSFEAIWFFDLAQLASAILQGASSA